MKPMLVHLVQARYIAGHRVWLRFDDGVEGEIDLAQELGGKIFEPLRVASYFATFAVDDTLTWSNGADFAPEFLHKLVVAGRRQPD